MAGRGAVDEAEDRAHWARRSACANEDIDRLFARGKAQHEAKKVCRSCPVALQCLAEALDNHVEFGVWGGLTERERRALLRRRPDVRSWYDLLLGVTGRGIRAG